MKKTFKLNATNKKYERQIDAAKHDIKKYIAREKRKKLPLDFNVWDFDCKIGKSEEDAIEIQIGEINTHISKITESECESFYLEILAKPSRKLQKKQGQ